MQIKKGRHLGFCLDLKGAAILKRIYPKNTVTVFVLPPSLKTLKTRIEGRCNSTDKKEVAQRLRLARGELLAAPGFDYCILNNNLRAAIGELKEIILARIRS